MVANNFFGKAKRLLTRSCSLVSLLLSSSFSLGFKEKKATSEPEISAEKSNKTSSTINAISVLIAKGLNKPANKIIENKGSGSKV